MDLCCRPKCSDERPPRELDVKGETKPLGMNRRLTGSQTLASCDYWLPWEFLYPSTAVTGLTDGSRPSALLGAPSDGRVDQAVAKKRPSFNRPSDGTDGPERYPRSGIISRGGGLPRE
ncbi:hypothetical protein B0H16DRAFT_1450167 [Mycena metata]|uniref:Uncharacterized protein n=1 Tax=Mycena metata TaxID=1033252 RepID=A0AAD7NTQ7_9AGAR|nr:hypothetical protein B0H16DRAFT_1450167 [Mycena metata]